MGMLDLVKALNNVDLPTLGSPTSPALMLIALGFHFKISSEEG